MIYCDSCREENGWPRNLQRLRAKCDVCKEETNDCSQTVTSTLAKMTSPDAPAAIKVIPEEVDTAAFPMFVISEFKKGPTSRFVYEGEVRLEPVMMHNSVIKLFEEIGEDGFPKDLDDVLTEEFGEGGEVLRRYDDYDGSHSYERTGDLSLGKFKITIERIEDVG